MDSNKQKKNAGSIIVAKVIVFAIIVLIGWNAFRAYNGEFDKEYVFTPHTLLGGFFIEDNPDLPPDMKHFVVFKTTSLSAQNPIKVDAKILPTGEFEKHAAPDVWSTLPDKQILLFPYSYKYPLSQYHDGSYEVGFVELWRKDDPKRYEGEGQIIYQFEDEYAFFLIGEEEEEQAKIRGEGITTLSFNASEIARRTGNLTRVPIESTDVTTNLKTNNIFLSLTLVLVAFAAADQHRPLTSVFSVIVAGLWNRVRRNKQKQPSTEGTTPKTG